MEWSAQVDWVQEHPVNQCSGCGASLEAEPVKERLLRQVFDIVPIELEVTEHQAEVKCCPNCAQQSVGQFPAEASNVVQYGPRLKGIMVYLMENQLLLSERTVELLSEVLGVQISEGTLYNAIEKCLFILEHYEQLWAFQMSVLLVTIHDQVQAAKAGGHSALAPEQLEGFDARYKSILEQGFEANPTLAPPPDSPKKRGRRGVHPERNRR